MSNNIRTSKAASQSVAALKNKKRGIENMANTQKAQSPSSSSMKINGEALASGIMFTILFMFILAWVIIIALRGNSIIIWLSIVALAIWECFLFFLMKSSFREAFQ